MLWDCERGDCIGIADSLESCPVCGTPRPPREAPGTPTEPPGESDAEGAEPGSGAAESGPGEAGAGPRVPPEPSGAVESAQRPPKSNLKGW